jgi:solute:Na+ symporter, SSS family
MWAVAVSVLATAQSAATFIGGPQQAYAGDLTYLSSNLGPVIAALVVGFFFIPRFYRQNLTSIYELIGSEMGSTAQRIASGMFMLGRVFASGARLYIVAIPFSLVAFGDMEAWHLVASILIVTIVATAYSVAGGIRAVIWTDVIQVAVYLGCMILALVLIWQRIPVSAAEGWSMLHEATTSTGGSKLRIIDFRLDFSAPFTLWTALIGLALFNIAAFGMDQDMTQRMLTCKTPGKGTWSVIIASLITWPVLLIFLGMGLLLWIYHQLPPEAFFDGHAPVADSDTRRVFLSFILTDMHAGVRGLMMAGLFAAAMSSMDSGLNAMSSTTIADFYRPWRKRRDPSHVHGDGLERRAARVASMGWAAVLAGFACFCIWWERATDDTLINFALGVMVYAYAGMLGVFFTAIFTTRGNAASAALAMAVGFVIVLALEPMVYFKWLAPALMWWKGTDEVTMTAIAFPWRLTIAACASFIVCVTGDRKSTALSSS